uniref:Calreticulin n=1 Tax=Parastrongyloides trichosuri TaxID=131310 RepID=A0A0N4Z451_PARTI
MRTLVAVLAISLAVSAEIYFKEEFDKTYDKRWVQSKHKDDYGKFELSAGKFFDDEKRDTGLKTTQDAKFYDIAAKFKKFTNKGKTLVIQFTAKHEQGIDCGGGYLKVLKSDVDLEKFHGETDYVIMFGPDICGPTKKIHVILNYKGKNHLISKEIPTKHDELTHQYTLILNPDNTYEVLLDNESVRKGELESDWEFLPPKKIKDPDAKKPEDWDEREYVDDPEDTKPEDWEKPEHIPDPDAKKPEDWDDEMDGDWEPPMIDNPEFKGEWKPKQIKNTAYKGVWIHPEIDNPEYTPDDEIYAFEDIGGVGIDIWQVKSGTIFDNIIITDSVDEAKAFSEETFAKLKPVEEEKKKAADEEERKKMEEAAKEAADKKDGEESKEDADEEEEKPEKEDKEDEEGHDEL